jgi:hypothetical protein
MTSFVLVPGSHHGGWSFDPLTSRLRDDPAWHLHELRSQHNLMRDVPDELARVVAAAADA